MTQSVAGILAAMNIIKINVAGLDYTPLAFTFYFKAEDIIAYTGKI